MSQTGRARLGETAATAKRREASAKFCAGRPLDPAHLPRKLIGAPETLTDNPLMRGCRRTKRLVSDA
jgi:hypothetical protein